MSVDSLALPGEPCLISLAGEHKDLAQVLSSLKAEGRGGQKCFFFSSDSAQGNGKWGVNQVALRTQRTEATQHISVQ